MAWPTLTEADDQVFESSDAGLIEQVLSRSYAGLRIDARGQRGGLRRTRSGLGPAVWLDRDQWTLAFDVTGAPLEVVVIAWLRTGQASCRSDGSERRHGAGEVFVPVQPGHPYSATSSAADVEASILDPALLGQVAATAPGRSRQPVRLTGYQPVSARAAKTWKATSAYLRDTVLASPGPAAQPLVAAGAARLLAATALTVFPSTALNEPTSQDRQDALPATLRRATAFIDEHAHTDITPADVAAAASVTIRAVQLAFRRHLDTTPTQYLRRVRLEAAHRELLSADMASTTVTAIAYRWGFPSSSRFAASYRHAYGLSPSQTLRQG